MATLVFDIETVGESWDTLDVDTQMTLTRWISRGMYSTEEQKAFLTEVRNGLGFSPFTGMIAAIGLYDVERGKGVVYYHGEYTDADIEESDFVFKSRSEKEMLEDFWDGALSYDTFVTFNGRGFDVPFLNIRSAVCGIRPTQNLMQGRYLSDQKYLRHVDLFDQMTYYGAVRKRPSLQLCCRAFGIACVQGRAARGDDVSELFRMKKFRDIAHRNAHTIAATTQLYHKWQKYLAPCPEDVWNNATE